jgi:hypothetical protein
VSISSVSYERQSAFRYYPIPGGYKLICQYKMMR